MKRLLSLTVVLTAIFLTVRLWIAGADVDLSAVVSVPPSPTATFTRVVETVIPATPLPSPTPRTEVAHSPAEDVFVRATPQPVVAPPIGAHDVLTHPLDIPLYQPNLLGDILILEYHAIGFPEDRWRRTPVNFRRDLEYLLSHGYYPVNLIDVVRGNLAQVPRGRRPVVLTFDDSSVGQFRYLADGSLDPNCAVGIIKAMHDEYGDDWPMRGTFFVLVNGYDDPGYPLFRQPALAEQKLRDLVEWGMEIGAHTMTHPNLSMLSAERIEWELAMSQAAIEAMIPGYEVRSLSVPFGDYPRDVSVIAWGYSELAERYYGYEAAVRVQGGPAPSPFSPTFDPLLIPRVQAIQSELNTWFYYYEQHPERYYVSGGLGVEN